MAPKNELAQQIADAAENVAAVAEYRRGEPLDYSDSSLAVVEELLDEAAGWKDELGPEAFHNLAQSFACYILEVGRRAFGGRYCWYAQRGQPVLVVGEPAFRVALLAWDSVQARLAGDPAASIPFLYTGFAQRVRQAGPGTDALYA